MTNTENNFAAQAGDAPMRAAFEAWLLTGSWRLVPPKRSRNGGYVHPGIQEDWLIWQAAQVSPRATADVERDLRAELINEGALRQYCHNDGSAGFVTAYDFDITNRFIAALKAQPAPTEAAQGNTSNNSSSSAQGEASARLDLIYVVCMCKACNPLMLGRQMFTCPKCGDKNCPHATNHVNRCQGLARASAETGGVNP